MRFACDPAGQLKTKKLNKKTNENKAAWKATGDAALQQLAAVTNTAGSNNGAPGHTFMPSGAANQAVPKSVGHLRNVLQHGAHDNNQHNGVGSHDLPQQPAQGSSIFSSNGFLLRQHPLDAATATSLPPNLSADLPVPMLQQDPGFIQELRSYEGLDMPNPPIDALEAEGDVSADKSDSVDEESPDEEDSNDEGVGDDDFDDGGTDDETTDGEASGNMDSYGKDSDDEAINGEAAGGKPFNDERQVPTIEEVGGRQYHAANGDSYPIRHQVPAASSINRYPS